MPRRGKTHAVQITPYKRSAVWCHPNETIIKPKNMKKATTILAVILLMAVGVTAQKLSYSSVVRNSTTNELVVNENLTVTISIANSNGGAVVYSETHSVTTNQNGLVTLLIGDGTGVTGSMSDVTWQTAYITSNYTLPDGSHVQNTAPVTAVPYALYAEKTGGSATGSAHVSDGNVTISMPISDFVSNLTDAEKAELCAALGCSGGGGGDEPGGDTPGGGEEPGEFKCGVSKMIDANGNEYETVKIGVIASDGQDYGNYHCWTKTNMRVRIFHNDVDCNGNVGVDPSLTATGHSTFDIAFPFYYSIPPQTLDDGTIQNFPAETYGYLYNFSGAQQACPEGWHLAKPQDFHNLFNYVKSKNLYCGTDEDNIAKALASKDGWNPSNVVCAVGNNSASNDNIGFSAFPAGYFVATEEGQDYFNVGSGTTFWSFDQLAYLGGVIPLYYLSFDSAKVTEGQAIGLHVGLSVRCVRNY